jgi:dTDP-glucose 4,6-dehydratase
MKRPILVTGGAGFIGSNFVLEWAKAGIGEIVNLDKLTYAGNLSNLLSLQGCEGYHFVPGDICDRHLVRSLMQRHHPAAIVHFAAESHVDRSILGPEEFVRTNVHGTFCLLEEARRYYCEIVGTQREEFRFLHVSTDEVYGSLGPDEQPFSETTRYSPNSPYSASKASSDHLVRAYHHTYGLPTLITNCSNNYGPYQFPEKLIPLMIFNALRSKPLPIYGDGLNVRDWLYVLDHCEAIRTVLTKGSLGETYNVGGATEKNNREVVATICEILQEVRPQSAGYESLITYVKDRPGHDRRYAIDSRKIQRELGWKPRETFETGMRKTILWYLENSGWVEDVTSGAYQKWVTDNYHAREAVCGK